MEKGIVLENALRTAVPLKMVMALNQALDASEDDSEEDKIDAEEDEIEEKERAQDGDSDYSSSESTVSEALSVEEGSADEEEVSMVLTLAMLQKRCMKLELPTKGNKADLVERIQKFTQLQPSQITTFK